VNEVEARVRGSLPSWLNGSLVINGGGDYSAGLHMFDGYALVAKIRLQGGRAYGSQRFLDTQAYRGYKATGGAWGLGLKGSVERVTSRLTAC
jgi:carotenoid cleavage dioxygenase-like enzyme